MQAGSAAAGALPPGPLAAGAPAQEGSAVAGAPVQAGNAAAGALPPGHLAAGAPAKVGSATAGAPARLTADVLARPRQDLLSATAPPAPSSLSPQPWRKMSQLQAIYSSWLASQMSRLELENKPSRACLLARFVNEPIRASSLP